MCDNIKFAVKFNLGNGYSIKECKSIKYLGLIVDSLLKFDLCNDHISRKIQKRIGAIYIYIEVVFYSQLNIEKCLLMELC